MALYMALSLLRMRWRLRAAPRIQDNVYRCTDWSTPFVLGVLAPRIYVPETVSEQDFPQVLAHERCHIRRWDHVWKPLAFLLLAVNWFNPILWAAYVLLGRGPPIPGRWWPVPPSRKWRRCARWPLAKWL